MCDRQQGMELAVMGEGYVRNRWAAQSMGGPREASLKLHAAEGLKHRRCSPIASTSALSI